MNQMIENKRDDETHWALDVVLVTSKWLEIGRQTI
jgi:hypothetical protein